MEACAGIGLNGLNRLEFGRFERSRRPQWGQPESGLQSVCGSIKSPVRLNDSRRLVWLETS